MKCARMHPIRRMVFPSRYTPYAQSRAEGKTTMLPKSGKHGHQCALFHVEQFRLGDQSGQ